LGDVTSYGNVSIGTEALKNHASTLTTAVGHNALKSNTTSGYSTAVGADALENSTGFKNDAFGYQSLGKNTTGGTNAAFGAGSLYNLTSGSSNTAIGNGAGYQVTTSSNSIFIGNSAGSNTSTKVLGQKNIYIGWGTKPSAENLDEEIVIGAGATGNGNNTITLGHTTNTAVHARGTVYSNGNALTSDRRLKTDINRISDGLGTLMKLNPVSYKKRLSFDTDNYFKNEFGFIAQEIREFLPELVTEGTDENKTLSLDYNSLIPILAKAIQEQQAVIDSLLKRIETLEAKN
jgi:hypothetical protein